MDELFWNQQSGGSGLPGSRLTQQARISSEPSACLRQDLQVLRGPAETPYRQAGEAALLNLCCTQHCQRHSSDRCWHASASSCRGVYLAGSSFASQ